ncbi:MAG TPA: EcsC family protein [Smithellaceae bacterium]|nr:EcsC family protein [Smithellaceae bacterium]
MSEKFNQNVVMKALDWAYDMALNGAPGSSTAQELAEDYLKKNGSRYSQVNSLIRWQNAKCATSGFLTGLGGLITLPVAIPANLTSVWYVQLRMIAAIAYMGGHDSREDRVRTLAYICLVGNGAMNIVKEFGINVGKKLAEEAIKKISGEILVKINQKVGMRLVTKFGEKGIINLCKVIPVFGGVIGGAFDLASTNVIGNVARNIFIED